MAPVTHIHLDPIGGLAGDMFIAAVLDAFPEHAAETFGAMHAAGLPGDWRVELVAHNDGVLSGHRLLIEGPPNRPSGTFRAIRERIQGAALAPGVADRAIAIFTELAVAEGAVHGVPVEEVHFHEIADWDSVADIVGAAHLIATLAPSGWSSAPLPLGGGRIETAHGVLPVPAPATARLLEGLAVHDDGIKGERVTPTGAAIARHLAPAPGLPRGGWRVGATGIGFGTRRLAGAPNVVRLLAYQQSDGAQQGDGARVDEQVAVIGFEIDDQSGEELALGLEALRAVDGVLDVIQMPAFGKKGRMVTRVQLLARPDSLDAVIERCFAETTTIGLRWRLEARVALRRELVRVGGVDDEVTVKVVRRPNDERTAKAEVDHARGATHATRTRDRQAAEAQALGERFDGGPADG